MLAVCVFVSLFIAVVALPSRCCVDHQFEAKLGEFGGTVDPITGKANVINGYNLMSYDYYTKMMRLEVHMQTPQGTYANTSVLIDYKAGKEYVLSATGCTVIDTNEKMRTPCIPAWAVYKDTMTFGYGDKILTVNAWGYTVPGTDNVVELAVTDDGCIPFAETSYGTMNNASTDVVYFIGDFQPGIKDRSVFSLPQNCQPGGKAVGVVGRAVRAMKNIF